MREPVAGMVQEQLQPRPHEEMTRVPPEGKGGGGVGMSLWPSKSTQLSRKVQIRLFKNDPPLKNALKILTNTCQSTSTLDPSCKSDTATDGAWSF